MKRIALASAALLALAGAASAAELTSGAQVTIDTLAPQLDASSLSTIQVRQINSAVASNDGLSQPELLTIINR